VSQPALQVQLGEAVDGEGPHHAGTHQHQQVLRVTQHSSTPDACRQRAKAKAHTYTHTHTVQSHAQHDSTWRQRVAAHSSLLLSQSNPVPCARRPYAREIIPAGLQPICLDVADQQVRQAEDQEHEGEVVETLEAAQPEGVCGPHTSTCTHAHAHAHNPKAGYTWKRRVPQHTTVTAPHL
jgi:hypothetical protein